MKRKQEAHLQEYRGRAATWVHVAHAGAVELRELTERFHFHEHDVHDVLPTLQHTKCIVRPEYLFLVLIFPYHDIKTSTVRETELDVFITKATLVTVNHGGALAAIDELAAEMTRASRRELILSQSPAEVLVNLLETIYKSIYPLLSTLSHEIASSEDTLWKSYDHPEAVSSILHLKTDNGRARKALQNHRYALITMQSALRTLRIATPHEEHFQNVVNRTTDLWNTLESQRESISYLYDTNSTLINQRSNEIMKTLTIFAVIIFPLTLLAALFAMRTEGMPLLAHPHGFWIIVTVMAVITVGMLGIFRAKRWL